MTAIRELDPAELDLVGGGLNWVGLAKAVATGFVAAVCKGSGEAIAGGIATGLETGGVGFVVAAVGGVAAAAAPMGWSAGAGKAGSHPFRHRNSEVGRRLT